MENTVEKLEKSTENIYKLLQTVYSARSEWNEKAKYFADICKHASDRMAMSISKSNLVVGGKQ